MHDIQDKGHYREVEIPKDSIPYLLRNELFHAATLRGKPDNPTGIKDFVDVLLDKISDHEIYPQKAREFIDALMVSSKSNPVDKDWRLSPINTHYGFSELNARVNEALYSFLKDYTLKNGSVHPEDDAALQKFKEALAIDVQTSIKKEDAKYFPVNKGSVERREKHYDKLVEKYSKSFTIQDLFNEYYRLIDGYRNLRADRLIFTEHDNRVSENIGTTKELLACRAYEYYAQSESIAQELILYNMLGTGIINPGFADLLSKPESLKSFITNQLNSALNFKNFEDAVRYVTLDLVDGERAAREPISVYQEDAGKFKPVHFSNQYNFFCKNFNREGVNLLDPALSKSEVRDAHLQYLAFLKTTQDDLNDIHAYAVVNHALIRAFDRYLAKTPLDNNGNEKLTFFPPEILNPLNSEATEIMKEHAIIAQAFNTTIFPDYIAPNGDIYHRDSHNPVLSVLGK